MKNILNIFSGVANWTTNIINFFSGFEKVSRTITAFKTALEMFEEERCKIWGNPKIQANTTVSKESNSLDTVLQKVDLKHSGQLTEDFKNDNKDV